MMNPKEKRCIMCGAFSGGSMDGPYVCPRCDCGIRPDGQKFDVFDARAYRVRVNEWRKAAAEGDYDREFPSIFGGDDDT